jgi:hypothetical protein
MRTRPLPIRMHLCHNAYSPTATKHVVSIPSIPTPIRIPISSKLLLVLVYILWLVTNRPPAGRRSVRYYYKPTDGAGAFMINRHSIINTVLELASLSCGPLSFEKPGLTHLKTIFSFRSHASTVSHRDRCRSIRGKYQLEHSAQSYSINIWKGHLTSLDRLYINGQKGREIDTDTRISLSSQSPATISIAWLSCHMLTL